MKEITKNEFTAFVNSTETVLLDFWAPWCGPCKMLAPVLTELENEYSGKIAFGKINVDQEKELASDFKIRGIPALVLIRNGEVLDFKVGFLSKNQIKSWLDSK